MSIWTVLQPKMPYEGKAVVHGNPWMDKSQHFTALDNGVVPYLETQRDTVKQDEEDRYQRWRTYPLVSCFHCRKVDRFKESAEAVRL
jgi:hypothetical protein